MVPPPAGYIYWGAGAFTCTLNRLLFFIMFSMMIIFIKCNGLIKYMLNFDLKIAILNRIFE